MSKLSPRPSSPFSSRLVALAAAGVTAVSLSAATPSFWQVSTQADLLKGEVVANISVDSDGRLTLGPINETVASTTQAALWAIVPNGQGGYFVGTGNDGEVLEVDARGRSEVIFDAEELQVHALAVGADGRLIIGTSPDGKVYVRPRGRGAPTTVLFDPEERYIWSLAVAPDGSIYVGTGDRAALYRIDSDGKAARIFESKATHVTAVAPTAGGDVVVGTDSPGQVLRVSPTGRAFLLIDTGFKEVRSIRPAADGAFYVAAMNGTGAAASAPSTGEKAPEPSTGTTLTPTVTTEVVMAVIGDATAPATPASATRKNVAADSAKGAIYRLATDGLWDQVWRTAEDLPYDVAALEGGDLLVATAPKGKIYRVTPSPLRTMLIARADAEQAVRFAPGAGDTTHVYITANPGRIYRLGGGPATEGTYESDVLDATTVATWGTLRWRAQSGSPGEVRIDTRSGNTPRPDETWSDWSAPYQASDASPITSPKARYLQWRVRLARKTGPGPALTSVTAAYLPRNIRPRVDSVTAHPAGVAFQKPFSTGDAELAGYDSGTADGRVSPSAPPAAAGAASGSQPAATTPLGRRIYQKGLQTLVWKAQDANGDRLQFDIHYRRESEEWRLLRRGLWDEVFTWDTTSVPDGTYSVKIVASDAPSNAPALALTGELESTAFDIDNTPPVIERIETSARKGRRVVRFRVRDAQSAIARVEYSLDATRWRFAYAVDGLADSREELFEIEVENGATAVPIVRVTDALNNVATTAIEN